MPQLLSSAQIPFRRPEGLVAVRGVALVIVLGFLVLISVLMVAFFLSVQTELQGAKSYASGVTSKQLAETATNIVISQIGDATKSFENPGNPATTPPQPGSGKRLTWASQPGLIHTYDETGKAHRTFKLYSAANMVDESGDDYNAAKNLSAEVPDTWPNQPAHFVDLNAPVLVSDASGAVIGSDGKNYTPDFPIVDPTAYLEVDGFDYNGVPGVKGGKLIMAKGTDPTKADGNFSGNPVPMPVRWHYVLKDGTVSAPDVASSATTTVSFSNYGPTAVNPIVGRIAYWTDDETSKLNINTASEGVFWDRPWADNGTERGFAGNLPRQNEFNRFAGHPAATCLSPVFKNIYSVAQGAPTPAELQPYLGTGSGSPGSGISPRVNIATDLDGKAVKIKNERLYASVDELLFKPLISAGVRTPFDKTKLSRTVLERAKFFVTAHSRAPEVNLFGQPRIALWPLQFNTGDPNTGDRTGKDKLIAFCTSVGNPGSESRFYFQRHSKYTGDGRGDQTDPMPSSQSISADWDQVPRNKALYAYLQRLTSNPVPGFGGNFATKLGDDRDQVLTEIMDYVRASVNSYNTALDPKYDYLPSRGYPKPGETQAVPLYIAASKTKGFGRFATITEAAIVFFATNATEDSSKPADKMQAYLILEPFNPTPGLASWSPHVRYVVEGLEKFTAGGTAMGFPGVDGNLNPRNYVTSRVGYSGGGHTTALMGLEASFRWFKDGGSDQNKRANRTDEETGYPFYSDKIPLPSSAFSFSGGDITISIYGGYDKKAQGKGKPTQLIQKITMNFPKASAVPVPTKTEVRIDSRFSDNKNNLIRDGDVVRSVEADFANPSSGGDYRILAGRYEVGSEFFKKHPNYDTPTERWAHSLRQNAGDFRGASNPAGPVRLVQGVTMGAPPVAARDLNGAFLKKGGTQYPGDWDNGNGNVEDGAYINKSDEGNTSTGGDAGYFGRGGFNVEDGTTFSPNRQISSAVSFGSLPTGVKRGQPWQTLLFCKNPAASDAHPGFDSPRDHLLLDLFTMPIVEPYAISEPFSTAGKVNLNFQIAPFTYITRSTAMRGVMKSTKIMAIPTADSLNYKSSGRDYRASINFDETLANGLGGGGFEERFAKVSTGAPYLGDAGIFRSASEICDMHLVPKTNGSAVPAAKLSDMKGGANGWWKNYKLTGDNAREYPYGHIYPRVTTKSNTYTVHVRVQVLKKVPSTNVTQWIEGKDQVLSEHRGSTIIERYIDPSDAALQGVDFATNATASLDDYYRFRTISTKKFAP